jgi:hypothetical protein
MYLAIFSVTLFIATAWGWLPGQQKDIYSISGVNLFDQSPTNGMYKNITAYRNTTAGSSRALKIRGVNLGSHFIVEPWMIGDIWASSMCAEEGSESDCVYSIGQQEAITFFENHWDTYITEEEIQQIAAYGLNTVRIPLGYWMLESLIDQSCKHGEYFLTGGFKYLERLVGWASDAGLYILLELHGAPDAQVTNAFTGQVSSPAPRSCRYLRAAHFPRSGRLRSVINAKSDCRNSTLLQPNELRSRHQVLRLAY